MSRKSRLFVWPFLLLLITSAAAAERQGKTLTVAVDLVMVNASVTDVQNQPVADLTPANFQLFEDRIEQQIRYFAVEEQPLSLGIILDVSHSMEKKIAVAREAAATFLESGTAEDEYFLVEFESRASLTADFTSDIARLREKMSFVPPQGTTALYDAVYLGLSKVRKGHNPRKALLLITDGEDNHSHYSLNDIREFTREADVQIYSIDLGRALIGELSEMTGGHSFRGRTGDLQDICSKIARELKSQYVIGYASSNATNDGKYRKIRLKLNPPAGMTRLSVRARDGYYAPVKR